MMLTVGASRCRWGPSARTPPSPRPRCLRLGHALAPKKEQSDLLCSWIWLYKRTKRCYEVTTRLSPPVNPGHRLHQHVRRRREARPPCARHPRLHHGAVTMPGLGGELRVRPHRRFAVPLSRLIPYPLKWSVDLFLARRCDVSLGGLVAAHFRPPPHLLPRLPPPPRGRGDQQGETDRGFRGLT